MKQHRTRSDSFGLRDKIGYMMGDFGCNMSFQLVSSYAMIYFTQGMGLTLGSWAVIVVLAKIFDAINDPIIGALVDRRKPSKSGKFRPWIFYGSFAILLTTTLFFIDIRALSYGLRFAYCLTMYCLWSIAYTATNVPYGSLNAVLTDDIAQRASLSSLRSIGAGLAVLPIMILMPKLIYGEKDAATGISPILPERFVWIALGAGLIGLIGFMLLYFLTRERIASTEKAQAKYEFKTALKAFMKNRPAIGHVPCFLCPTRLLYDNYDDVPICVSSLFQEYGYDYSGQRYHLAADGFADPLCFKAHQAVWQKGDVRLADDRCNRHFAGDAVR